MWKACIVIAFVLTIFCVVKTFQMSKADQERGLSSYTSLSAMRYFSLLSNEDTLYQTMDLKCNNGSLHGLLTSVFNVSMAINRLATNFRCVLPSEQFLFLISYGLLFVLSLVYCCCFLPLLLVVAVAA